MKILSRDCAGYGAPDPQHCLEDRTETFSTVNRLKNFSRITAILVPIVVATLFAPTASAADTSAPTGKFSAPLNKAFVAGTTVIKTVASDNAGTGTVSRIDVMVDGVIIGSPAWIPAGSTTNWNTTTYSEGLHTLTARLVDAAGNVGLVPAIKVTVHNDVVAPTVSLTSPSACPAKVSGEVTLTATMTDDRAIQKFVVLVDGVAVTVSGTKYLEGKLGETRTVFSTIWKSWTSSYATHTLQVRAYDASNNTTDSPACSVAVSRFSPEYRAISRTVNTVGATALNPEVFTSMWDSHGGDGGWTGGDRTRSIPLPDGSVLWLFGDSYLGQVNADRSRYVLTAMPNNTMVVQDGTSLTTLLRGAYYTPLGSFLPTQTGEWYWPVDAEVYGKTVRVVLDRFGKKYAPGEVPPGEEGFNFESRGTDIATLTLPDLRLIDITPEVTNGGGGGIFLKAGGVLVQADFTYVIGERERTGSTAYDASDKYDLFVGRVTRGWLGKMAVRWHTATGTWSTNTAVATPITTGTGGSISLIKTLTGFAIAEQASGYEIWSGDVSILASTALSLGGPWSPLQEVFRTLRLDGDATYDGQLHPEFNSEGKTLLTYNVNGECLFADVDCYRPHFISIDASLFE